MPPSQSTAKAVSRRRFARRLLTTMLATWSGHGLAMTNTADRGSGKQDEAGASGAGQSPHETTAGQETDTSLREDGPDTPEAPQSAGPHRGVASWYGRSFQGRPTSSGEPFDMHAMTAAHPSWPIPSYARVKHLASGREVVVRINDRGPFHGGRIIDLSHAAAARLGIVRRGSAMVEIERLASPPPEATPPVRAQPTSRERR